MEALIEREVDQILNNPPVVVVESDGALDEGRRGGEKIDRIGVVQVKVTDEIFPVELRTVLFRNEQIS